MAQHIGIFGGSFNPIHCGHMALANGFARQLSLDILYLIPAAVPPHKSGAELAAAEHRLKMCKLAAADNPVLQVSDMEIHRQGASYTVDTLEDLRRRHPHAHLYLMVGADMFLTLPSWHRFSDIAKLATICAAPREHVGIQRLQQEAEALQQYGVASLLIDIPLTPVSSTDIRERVKAGRSIEGLVPLAVAAYIAEKGLYR